MRKQLTLLAVCLMTALAWGQSVALKATKEIKVTDSFSIPIFGQVVGNPCSQKAYLVLGFTLQP